MHVSDSRELLKAEIAEAGGIISFAQYMQQVLYAPAVGYYTSGLQKFGRTGDFVTAPEISPLFSGCVARQIEQVLAAVGQQGDVLEFGAGTGRLAAELLVALAQAGQLPRHYYILELSAELQQRQHDLITRICPQFLDRVIWLQRLPEQAIKGVVIANEVLDAMPVERFCYDQGELSQSFVQYEKQQFVEHFLPVENQQLLARAQQISEKHLCHLNTPYVSEINLYVTAWMQSVSACLQQGLVLLIDYGFPQHEYYHPDRQQGTLMCHHQQKAHSNPFIHIGAQDVTAHVDFTAVAEAAVDAKLEVAGYTTQAAFLINCQLLELLQQQQADEKAYWQATQAVNLLTSPAEMGELFKVLALTRQLDSPLIGFSAMDRRSSL